MLTYQMFYRHHGIRLLPQLVSPPMTPIEQLVLPANSIFHYMEQDEQTVGIEPDDPIIHLNKGVILIDHVWELNPEASLGHPRPMPFQFNQIVLPYHKHHKQFKRLSQNIGMLRNPRNLLVVSYTLLAHRYRYQNNFLTPYNRWHNVFKTVLEKVIHYAQTTDRQQFIQLHLPDHLPSISQLNQSANHTSRPVMKRFNTDSLRILADMWHWLGVDRGLEFDKKTEPVPPLEKEDEYSEEEKAVLADQGHNTSKYKDMMSVLTADVLKRINLVWLHGGMWTTLNLGNLETWRKGNPEEKSTGNIPKLAPALLQKRFLRLQMSIAETTTATVNKGEPEEGDHLHNPVAVETDEDGDENNTQPSDFDLVGHFRPNQSDPGVFDATGQKVGRKGSLVEIINKAAKIDTASNDDDAAESLPEVSDDDVLRDLEQLEVVNRELDKDEKSSSSYHEYQVPEVTLESGVASVADEMVKKGLLSAAEHRRMVRIAGRFKEIANPFGGKGKLADLTVIKPEEIKVEEQTLLMPSIPGVKDKSMLSSSIKSFDNRYIREILPKDIASTVLTLQKAGVAIQDYNIQKVDDFTDSFDVHVVKLIPVIGKPTTIRMQTPRVNEDGSFFAGGVKYRMRKQRGDLPIRKVSPNTVSLTSYYSKMFVKRSERAVNNYGSWLENQIVSRGITMEDESVTNIKMSDVFYHDVQVPRVYSTIAARVNAFETNGFQMMFDYAKRDEFFGDVTVKAIEGEKHDRVLIGKNNRELLFMNFENDIYKVDNVNPSEPVLVGKIEQLIGIPMNKRPLDIAEVDIFGKTIPVVYILAYHIGLGNLISTMKATCRRVKTGNNYDLQEDEYIVKFEDEALIFKRDEEVPMMLFAGLNRFHRDIKYYSVYSFDKKDVYGNVFEDNGIGARHLREFDLMFKMWVDHITLDLLKDMGEPTDLFNLFISAVRKLKTDFHPAQMDNAWMRDKGYERVAGLMYFELVKAMRVYNSKPANANAAVEVNPQAVWMSILQDQSVMPIEESNPIQCLKEKEEVISSGKGGRTARSMTEKSRQFHANSIGVVSEATKDNADVATITYLTADPNYTSLRGTTRRLSEAKGNAAKIVSTSMLLAPGADIDDPKRVNFINIQNSQTVHCEHYTPLPCRTGYERVIPHRTDELYAKTARTDGVVTELTDKVITVHYKDDEVVHYELGRRFGKWAGHVIPHEIITPLKKGSKVKQGTVICYNKKYFTPDHLDPTQIMMKTGVLARTVLWESTDTLDDSSAISSEFAKKLVTLGTHVRNIKVTFDQEVRNLLRAGEEVDHESILCTIHNATAGNADIYDEAALSTLSILASSSPRAKMIGKIEKIEVIYTGDLEDMTGTLRALAEKSDNDIRKLNKQLGKKAADGKVEVGYRVDGHPMDSDTAVIRVYITGPTEMGIGDKAVFANQMKSIVARVFDGVNETEDGQPIDAMFGYLSVANRIVLSAELTGTANTLLKRLGDLAVEAYESK